MNIKDELEKYGLSDPLESVGMSTRYCDYTIILLFPAIVWMSYVQYFFPARQPWSYAISPIILLIVFIFYRIHLAILAKDLENGFRSKDIWSEFRNTAITIGGVALIQNTIFFGFYGNNLNKIMSLFILIAGSLSLIHILTPPADSSEIYKKTPFMKIKLTRRIIEKMAKIVDKM